jgi:hypothetical protein
MFFYGKPVMRVQECPVFCDNWAFTKGLQNLLRLTLPEKEWISAFLAQARHRYGPAP